MRRNPVLAIISVGFHIWVSVATALLPSAPPVLGGFPTTLTLQRAFPIDKRVRVSQLRTHDRVRHGRILQSVNGVVDFPVYGTYDPYLVGLYFTTVKLGTPAQEFHVQIDTGSDVLWVSCTSCSGCPTTSGLQEIGLNFFDASSSSTAQAISCSDQKCNLGSQSSDSICNSQNNQCSYQFQYGDGSGTSGYYFSDIMHLDAVSSSGATQNTSNTAPVVFGCSMVQTGDLTKADRAVDGIFGFGQQSMSVISQLSSQGIMPPAFSHCLRGDSNGGGILVFGEIVEPGMVFTPLVPDQPHYNVYMESISVNGQFLPIDSSAFDTSSNTGTIIDSGTTLAYLAEAAYTPFLGAINNIVSQSVRPLQSKGNQCYLITSSVDQVFPKVSLNFKGGASMILDPQDYLLEQNSIGGAAVWCMGFQKIQGQSITILGDLVLKNKAVVYDLARQRIGWVNYDCSGIVNVSVNMNATATNTNAFISTGEMNDNKSSRMNPPFYTKILALEIEFFDEIAAS
ncbi:hypothetical protein V2J09_019261 [Rumex salicifolius]